MNHNKLVQTIVVSCLISCAAGPSHPPEDRCRVSFPEYRGQEASSYVPALDFEELCYAIEESGAEVAFIPGELKIDFKDSPVVLRNSVTIMGDRGVGYSKGALLYSSVPFYAGIERLPPKGGNFLEFSGVRGVRGGKAVPNMALTQAISQNYHEAEGGCTCACVCDDCACACQREVPLGK